MGLRYRMHSKQDVPELVHFWSEHSGWDVVDQRRWSLRFHEAPFGPASIALAVDAKTDRIVGQLAFFPSLLHVKGHGEVTAMRAFAPVVAGRERGRLRIVERMYEHATEALAKRHDACIYKFPERRWAAVLRRYDEVLSGSFPTYSLALPLERPLLIPSMFTLGAVGRWDDRVDHLWAQGCEQHGVTVVRDSRSLPWKIGRGDFHVTAVERRGELVALVAHREKGDGQWLICDVVAVDADSLDVALRAAVNAAHEEALKASRVRPIRHVDIIATAVLRPLVEDLGFTRVGYDFPLAIHRLSDGLSDKELAPERWYVSAND